MKLKRNLFMTHDSLTVTWRNKEVVSECCKGSDDSSLNEFVFFILKLKVILQQLICGEIGSVSRDTSTRDHLSSFPKSKEAFFSI